jgi:hypothetical protein
MAALASLLLAASASAAPCDSINEAGRRINQEQLEFTKRAYSDGVITGQESEEAEVYSEAITKNTEELAACINGDRPYTDGFELSGETFKTAGGFSLKIQWETNTPSKALITFQREEKGKEVPVGALHVHWKEGGIVFHGKVGGVKLKPGKYFLTLVETDGEGHESPPESAKLRVLPTKR